MALLPEPRDKHLVDQTGLTVFQYDKRAPGLLFCDVVVVKASFALTAQGILPVPMPGELSLADTTPSGRQNPLKTCTPTSKPYPIR